MQGTKSSRLLGSLMYDDRPQDDVQDVQELVNTVDALQLQSLQSQKCGLVDLPMEVLVEILENLPLSNLPLLARVDSTINTVAHQLLNREVVLTGHNLEAFRTMLEVETPSERAKFLASIQTFRLHGRLPYTMAMPTMPVISRDVITKMASILTRINPQRLDISFYEHPMEGGSIEHIIDVPTLLQSVKVAHLRHLTIAWDSGSRGEDEAVLNVLKQCSRNIVYLNIDVRGASAPRVKPKDAPDFPQLKQFECKAEKCLGGRHQNYTYWFIKHIIANAPKLDTLHLSAFLNGQDTFKSQKEIFGYYGPKLQHLRLTTPAFNGLRSRIDDLQLICPNITTLTILPVFPVEPVTHEEGLGEAFPALEHLQALWGTTETIQVFVEQFKQPTFLPRLKTLYVLMRYDKRELECMYRTYIARVAASLEARRVRFKIDTAIYSDEDSEEMDEYNTVEV